MFFKYVCMCVCIIINLFFWYDIESIDQFVNNWHLNNSESSKPWISFYLFRFLWFLSSEFCSFLHINTIYILLNIYLDISVTVGSALTLSLS